MKKYHATIVMILMFTGINTIVSAGDINPAPAFTEKDLTALPRANWVTNGGNLFNQRYSPLDQINKGNIADVKAVWRTRMGSGLGARHNNQAQLLAYEGVLYNVTGEDDVFAL